MVETRLSSASSKRSFSSPPDGSPPHPNNKRSKVSSVQLRDNLLSMLVVGHETIGSVLTWILYLLSKVQLRWAIVPDVLPGNYKVNAGQDIMISVYNINRSSQNIYRFIPFSGGPRKCVGDQFALLEAIVALAIFVQKINFELVPDQNINMTTDATIHTTNGLHMKLSQRSTQPVFVLYIYYKLTIELSFTSFFRPFSIVI
ncbi:hypothetical protein GIB67_017318 [Kingdonia uniflora]|uniref:Cytochrome P450 n=1 Tax=Kingdonia uniflora TaxID=39325 RepID=A0A7J7N5Y6_9MAGN|nr:hypothetical protein GIB67_017318 [Kingdonia uniflora]